MSSCLAEYLLVAGISSKRKRGTSGVPAMEGSTSLSSSSILDSRRDYQPQELPDLKVPGVVLQRFPSADRKDSPLPGGIELFCCPGGWHLTHNPRPPWFIDFILTGEDGARLYCSSLNFHQLTNQEPFSLLSGSVEDLVESPVTARKRSMMKWKKSPECEDRLDEEAEANLTAGDVLSPLKLYEPLALCVVSKQPLFQILKACLKSMYISWLSSQAMEPLVIQLLSELRLPAINCLPIKTTFGALTKLVIPPIHEESSLPYTSTAALDLLKNIGVHDLLLLISALLCDTRILFISTSYTALTAAARAIVALIYPLNISHSLVPVVPHNLLEYVHLPSTYIMGIHSSLRSEIDELGDLQEVVEVNLDHGHVHVPDCLSLPPLPPDIADTVQWALTRILHPHNPTRDYVFRFVPQHEGEVETKADEATDCEVRAVFLCLLMVLLGDYQHFVTVIRFFPSPQFYFNTTAFLESRNSLNDFQSLYRKLTESIAFLNFCQERSVPYRDCDFFDELVARSVANPDDFHVTRLFSQHRIQELAEEIRLMHPGCVPEEGAYETNGLSAGTLDYPTSTFPTLNEAAIKEGLGKRRSSETTLTTTTTKSEIPLLETTPFRKPRSSSFNKHLESIQKCLDAIFHSKIIEARKYIPSVVKDLKTGVLSNVLVPELVGRFLQFSALLSSEQFDLVVKLLNAAIIDTQSALLVLPLATIIYREVHPGVQQYASTCLQKHLVWSKLEFWRDALYLAIQAELVRIYTEAEESSTAGHTQREESPEPADIGDITLRSRQRLRSSSPRRLRATLKAAQRLVLSRSARSRIRVSAAVPGISEGVLPPDAEPVTAQEALHHLAKMSQLWAGLGEEKQTVLIRQEENAVMNQLILFVQRVINLRTPVEFPGGDGDRDTHITEIEEFIGKLLRMVEVDLQFYGVKHGVILEQTRDMILMHTESMAGLRKELKRLPISKPKVLKPPLLPGETLLMGQGVHCYLMSDGRDNQHLTPADGQVFLTSYRVVFLGTPCDVQAPNLVVTRSMPVASIFRLKRLPASHIPLLNLPTAGGLQIRSASSELLKIAFEEETSQMDIKNLLQQITHLRYPSKITLGLRSGDSTNLGAAEASLSVTPTERALLSSVAPNFDDIEKSLSSRTRNTVRHKMSTESDPVTRVKLLSDISTSPCCQEYNRLQLGSLVFTSGQAKGLYKVTDINLAYSLCPSYPAVLVVPEKVTDESLTKLASQFTHSRFPVVTWKHPEKQAVLLRSSSFVPSMISRKSLHTTGGAKPADNVYTGGVGLYNVEVENYLYHFILPSKQAPPSSDLISHLSIPPRRMEFDRDMRRESFRSNDSDSTDGKEQANGKLRGRALTMDVYQIRSRIGSFVSHVKLSKRVAKRRDSPSKIRKYSISRKPSQTSPVFPRRSVIEIQDSYSATCTPRGTLERPKSGGHAIQDTPKSASNSPSSTPPERRQSLGHRRARSSDQIVDLKLSDIDLSLAEAPPPRISPIDWDYTSQQHLTDEESKDDPVSRPTTSTPDDYDGSSPDLLTGSTDIQWEHFHNLKHSMITAPRDYNSPGTVATLPTNPRDYVVMDMLPDQLSLWKPNAMYILGDRAALKDIPDSLYPNCTIVPVDVPSPAEVTVSYKKLMRACAPSSGPSSLFMSAVEESGWLSQLSRLLELAGAVVDLIDVQGSSVLVCLEDGWDNTAQVVSVAQVLLDPHYRTIEGFRKLVEKDWLSFGHKFSSNGHHTLGSHISDFSPVFLQFLDAVHQILHQFPLSFEFNDFYLRMMAYHHCSMRFTTFTLDSEKERYANNWLPYRPRLATLHGSQGEPQVPYWDHIDTLHKDSMLFYNFKYLPREDQEPLRPYSFLANLDIWCYYLDNFVSQFPPYDAELISDGPLTLLDFHHNIFEKEKVEVGIPLAPPGSVMSEISTLLRQFTGIMNTMAARAKVPDRTWKQLWDGLQSVNQAPMVPANKQLTSHGQTLHKRTTMAVLIKGKLSMSLEQQYTHPHRFEPAPKTRRSNEIHCAFCKHTILRGEKQVFQCRSCHCVTHSHCRALLPMNCTQGGTPGHKRLSREELLRVQSTPSFLLPTASEIPDLYEGWLYKRGKIVRNWKLRWFVLDTAKKEIRYYETKDEVKSSGVISLVDVTGVEMAEPHTIPYLRPGEAGFFFNVSTPRRIFYLMALREAERTEWKARIASAVTKTSFL